MTENQKHILKKIGKLAVYTAMTGGAYFLAKGALSLVLSLMEEKVETKPKVVDEKEELSARQTPNIIENSKIRSAAL